MAEPYIPSLDEFLSDAKPLNPNATNAELIDAYHQHFGVERQEAAPRATLPTFEEFKAEAQPLNPDATTDELHQAWQDNFGVLGARETKPSFWDSFKQGAKQGWIGLQEGVEGLKERQLDPNDPLKHFTREAGDALAQEAAKQGVPEDLQTQPFWDRVKDPEWLGNFLGNTLAQSAPSLGGAVVGGLVGGPPGAMLGMGGVTLLQEAGQSYREAYDKYIKAGFSEQKAHENAYQASGVSGVISGMVNSLAVPASLMSPAKGVMKNLFMRYMANVAIDTGDQATGNIVAKATYDPTREVTSGTPEAALGSALLGAPETMGAIKLGAAPKMVAEQRATPDQGIKPDLSGHLTGTKLEVDHVDPILKTRTVDDAVETARKVTDDIPIDMDALEKEVGGEAKIELDKAAKEADEILKTKKLEEDQTLLDDVQVGKTLEDAKGSQDLAIERRLKAFKFDAIAPQDLPDTPVIPEKEPYGSIRRTMSRPQYEALNDILSLSDTKMVLYEKGDGSKKNRDGFVDRNIPGTIFVNAKSVIDPSTVAFHELQHILQKNELFDGYRAVLKEELASGAMDLAKQFHGKKLKSDAVFDEIMADVHGDAMSRPDFHQKLIQKIEREYGEAKTRTKMEQFVQDLRQKIAKITQLITRREWRDAEGKTLAERYVKNLERVHDALATALAKHYKAKVDAQKVADATPTEMSGAPTTAVDSEAVSLTPQTNYRTPIKPAGEQTSQDFNDYLARVKKFRTTTSLPEPMKAAVLAQERAERTNDQQDPHLTDADWKTSTVSIESLKKKNPELFTKGTFQPRGSVTKGPIVLDREGTVLDGNNRVYEAVQRGDTTIEAFHPADVKTAAKEVSVSEEKERQKEVLTTEPEPVDRPAQSARSSEDIQKDVLKNEKLSETELVKRHLSKVDQEYYNNWVESQNWEATSSGREALRKLIKKAKQNQQQGIRYDSKSSDGTVAFMASQGGKHVTLEHLKRAFPESLNSRIDFLRTKLEGVQRHAKEFDDEFIHQELFETRESLRETLQRQRTGRTRLVDEIESDINDVKTQMRDVSDGIDSAFEQDVNDVIHGNDNDIKAPSIGFPVDTDSHIIGKMSRLLSELRSLRIERAISKLEGRTTAEQTDEDVAFLPGPNAHGPTYTVSEPTTMDTVIRNLQDKHVDLKRLIEAMQQSGIRVPDDLNPIFREEMYHKRSQIRADDFTNKELKPLIDAMRSNNVTLQELDQYAHARHVINDNLNERLQQMNPDLMGTPEYEKLAGITDDEARKILNTRKKKVMESLMSRVDAMVEKTRDMMIEYGLESQQRIDGWREQYRSYVPLHREGFQEEGKPTGTGMSVRGTTAKDRLGSALKVVDVIANVAQARDQVISRGEKMRPVVALAGLLLKYPNKDLAKLNKYAPVTTTDPTTGLEVTIPGDLADYQTPMVKRKVYPKFSDYLASVGFTEDEFMSEPIQERKRLRAEFPAWAQEHAEVKLFPDPSYKGRDNVVNFRIGGKDYAIIFNERNARANQIARGLKNLDTPQLNAITKAVAPFTRYMASINTQYNPIFGIKNLIRDAGFVAATLSSTELAGKQTEVLGNARRMMGGIYTDARAVRRGEAATSDAAHWWERFERVGGPTGYRDLFFTSTERAEAIHDMLNPKAWSKIRSMSDFTKKLEQTSLFQILSDYNLMMENALRLGVFKAGVDAGLSDIKAASLAKNISVNFNRKGQQGAQIGALYAFFNASVQGSTRILETVFERTKDPLTVTSGYRLTSNGKRIITGGILLGALQASALAIMGFEDDEPPEFVKSRNLVLPAPGTEKGHVAVPLPLGFNLLPTIGRLSAEMVADFMRGRPLNAITKGGHFLDAAMDMFNPLGSASSPTQMISPTIGDPLVALMENKDWTGKQIYREDISGLRRTPGHERAKDTATIWAIGISKMFNWATGGSDYVPGAFSPSPDAIDYLINQATGGIGREFISKPAQTIRSLATGEELPTHKYPVVGGFFGSASGTTGMRNRFYENIREVNAAAMEIEGRMKHGENFSEFLKDHPEAGLKTTALRFQKQLGELRRQKADLLKTGASREQVQLKEKQMTNIMQLFNQQVERVRTR